MENPGVRIIFEVGAEALVDHALPQCFIQHRKRHFDASKEIAIHPIGAGEKDPVVAVVQKIEDPAMFEKPSDDRTYADMFREARDAGSQGAGTSDDQVDFHPGLRGLVEGPNDLRLQERIHLRDDVGLSLIHI